MICMLDLNIAINKRNIHSLINKYQQYGTLYPQKAITRKITQEMVARMNTLLEVNDELTASRLSNKHTEKWPSLEVRGVFVADVL